MLLQPRHGGPDPPSLWAGLHLTRDQPRSALPNICLTSEKTRSDAAELGVMAKMIRAALAHVGKLGLYVRHHLSKPTVYVVHVRVVEAGACGARRHVGRKNVLGSTHASRLRGRRPGIRDGRSVGLQSIPRGPR